MGENPLVLFDFVGLFIFNLGFIGFGRKLLPFDECFSLLDFSRFFTFVAIFGDLICIVLADFFVHFWRFLGGFWSIFVDSSSLKISEL